jgi:replicative DNA helicase
LPFGSQSGLPKICCWTRQSLNGHIAAACKHLNVVCRVSRCRPHFAVHLLRPPASSAMRNPELLPWCSASWSLPRWRLAAPRLEPHWRWQPRERNKPAVELPLPFLPYLHLPWYMPRPSRKPAAPDQVLEKLVQGIDARSGGASSADTIPSGFPSLDKILAGGLRQRDLVILSGDVASGKSALALAIAIRVARSGAPTLFMSGEASTDRIMERALAMEAKTSVDDLRRGQLSEAGRTSVGAAAVRLRDLPLAVKSMRGSDFSEVADALDIIPARRLLVIDSIQLTGPPRQTPRLEERVALAVRALKSLAVERDVAVLALSQLPRLRVARPDPRPKLDDLGGLGAIKENADVILALYREEMYRPGQGVEGATELILAKNRNGPTGFVDLYFYPQWLRFVDMLDAD